MFKALRIPYLVPLFLAVTLLLGLAVWLLGGSPWGAPRATPEEGSMPTDGEPDLPPITCVVIDAGHGGEDGGASSASGVVEKELNLAMAFALRDLCEVAGIRVVMTRTEDVLLYDRNVDFQGRKKVLDLAARRMIAEQNEGCLFVSIHMNAFPQPQYSGTQVWYGTGDSRSAEIAQAVQSAATALQPGNHRKIKAAGSNIYLLDRVKSPAILVECGFLSNPEEADRLSKEDYQRALAMAVFTAIAPFCT